MGNAVLQRLVDEREQINRDIDHVNDQAEHEERDPSESERGLIARYRARLVELEPMIIEQLDLEEQRHAARDASATLQRAGGRGRSVDVVTSDAGTPGTPGVIYRTFAQYARDQIITRFDQIAALVPDQRPLAVERLQRAVANTITSDVGGLLPPQHLAQIMQVITRARPFVEASRRVNLTNGTLTYPWIASRPTVGVQAAEKTETTSTKMQVDMKTVTAKTYLGAGDLSWQTIQWATPDALQLWFDLAAEAYAKATELNTAATIGSIASATVVASDDLAGWYGAIAEAAGAIYARTGQIADTIYSDVATGFRLAGLVSNTTPAFATAGQINLSTAQGNIGGLRLVVSPMAAAGVVVVGASQLVLCAETAGAPVELRAVEPSIGGMEVGVIGAFADTIVDAGAFQKLTPPAGTVTASAPASGGK